ncbi:MAG: NAD(P)/FAD-dependent oxidoreductase [Pyrinomonadaceae bacterium]
MTFPRSNNYDVIIAGGGPAGSSLAIRLALNGKRVLLAEQKRFPREKLCGEFISPECLAQFAELGVLDQMMEPDGTRLTDTVFYSMRGRAVTVPSAWFGDGGQAALGLSRAEMDARLLARARAVGIDVCEETSVTRLIDEAGTIRGVQLRAADRTEHAIRAALTVDATGRGRALARLCANENRRESTAAPFVAFKAHMVDARIEPGHCEIYVYHGGYGGVNAIEGGRFNHCFIVRADLVRSLNNDAERVVREVVMTNQRANQTLVKAQTVTPWLAVALPWYGRRELIPQPGLITIGDAASFIDPFTGSGMLMALESGEVAAAVILRWGGDAQALTSFADHYRHAYEQRFRQRLRVSHWLRHAAFMPRLAAILVRGLGRSKSLRRRLARATRNTNKLPETMAKPLV